MGTQLVSPSRGEKHHLLPSLGDSPGCHVFLRAVRGCAGINSDAKHRAGTVLGPLHHPSTLRTQMIKIPRNVDVLLLPET